MQTHPSMLGLIVVAFVVLPSCISGGAGTGGPTLTTSGATATGTGPEGSEGRIVGSVTDPELRPIDSARVVLQTDGEERLTVAEASSDVEGRFEFVGLSDGSYIVAATRDGFRDAPARAVAVLGAEPARVSLVMEPVAKIEGFHVTIGGRMMFQNVYCLFVMGEVNRCGSGIGLENLSKAYNVNEADQGPLQAVIAEATWIPTSAAACNPSFRIDVRSPGAKTGVYSGPVVPYDPPHQWTSAKNQTRAPLYVFIPREGESPEAMLSESRTLLNASKPININGNWTARPWYNPVGQFGTPVDVMCAVTQPVDYYLSLFFVEPVAKGWSVFKK